MSPALGLAQAARRAAALRLLEAGETFGPVEVEVLVCDDALQPQEVLHTGQLPGRVCDQPLPVHKVDLSQGEVAQPVLQVQSVQADPDGVPGGVHQAQALVPEGEFLEARKVRRFGQSLGVVGYRSGDGVTHHDDQLGVPGHGRDPVGRLPGNEVARRLLHGDLAVQRSWH